jgi:Predicted membrane protein (DUF2339)
VESALVVLAVGVVTSAVLSPVLALIALVRLSRTERFLNDAIERLGALERRVTSPRSGPSATAPVGLAERRAAAPVIPPPQAPTIPVPAATAPPSGAPSTPGSAPSGLPRGAPPPPVVRPAPASSSRRSPRAPAPSPDFVASLGPRLLVAAGGLAVVVFLGLFVRYAWENGWVGPAGRVLSGAVLSLALVAAGLRLLDREYRPLGQGLAASGFAGLYVSLFAAHAVYALVPRLPVGALMVAVVVCAVAVADRLEARLLSGLAWVGGYLTPLLLSTGEDRAESLLPWLLLLGAAAAWLARRRPWPETVPLALVGTLVLCGGWAEAYFRAERFGIAAAGLVLLTALFALGPSVRALPPVVPLLAGGAAAVGLAAGADRPMALLALLVALTGVALLAHRRWPWAEATSAALGALAVLVWYERFFRLERAPEALALGLTVAGAYVLALAVRGLILGSPLGLPDAITQVASAALAWGLLDRVVSPTRPSLLGAAAVCLAALHLALGLAGRRRGPALLSWARVALGLSAVFVTIAIPVQLGLHGATLGWAAWGLVLVWLAVRQGSPLLEVGGHAVLLLAVGRLVLRHVPLHSGPFTLVLNPTFGTWLLVIVALLGAGAMSPGGERGRTPGHVLSRLVLGPLALVLLFALLTGETNAFFAERARSARVAGDLAAAVEAWRYGGLALSLLWTVFATALLGAGLLFRSRALFYAAYGLFALTALKVVMVDLSTLPTLHRMLSFLALGVLLLAGAWLNLRFRERLLTRRDGA